MDEKRVARKDEMVSREFYAVPNDLEGETPERVQNPPQEELYQDNREQAIQHEANLRRESDQAIRERQVESGERPTGLLDDGTPEVRVERG